MPITYPEVRDYLDSFVKPDNDVLAAMEEYAKQENFPIIGPLCGRVLYQNALAIGAKTVFEMGSGFGYSTYWFAKAVGAGGSVVHTDGSEALSAKARDYLGSAGLVDRVSFEVGFAQRIIERYDGPYDVIYIDVDKDGYPECWNLAKTRVRPGGLIITDNILWSGRVAEPNPDATTQAIQQYTQMAYREPGFLTTIIPLRDGMAVSLRTS